MVPNAERGLEASSARMRSRSTSAPPLAPIYVLSEGNSPITPERCNLASIADSDGYITPSRQDLQAPCSKGRSCQTGSGCSPCIDCATRAFVQNPLDRGGAWVWSNLKQMNVNADIDLRSLRRPERSCRARNRIGFRRSARSLIFGSGSTLPRRHLEQIVQDA